MMFGLKSMLLWLGWMKNNAMQIIVSMNKGLWEITIFSCSVWDSQRFHQYTYNIYICIYFIIYISYIYNIIYLRYIYINCPSPPVLLYFSHSLIFTELALLGTLFQTPNLRSASSWVGLPRILRCRGSEITSWKEIIWNYWVATSWHCLAFTQGLVRWAQSNGLSGEHLRSDMLRIVAGTQVQQRRFSASFDKKLQPEQCRDYRWLDGSTLLTFLAPGSWKKTSWRRPRLQWWNRDRCKWGANRDVYLAIFSLFA